MEQEISLEYMALLQKMAQAIGTEAKVEIFGMLET
jgi:hypothetical protein